MTLAGHSVAYFSTESISRVSAFFLPISYYKSAKNVVQYLHIQSVKYYNVKTTRRDISLAFCNVCDLSLSFFFPLLHIKSLGSIRHKYDSAKACQFIEKTINLTEALRTERNELCLVYFVRSTRFSSIETLFRRSRNNNIN